MSNEIVKYNYDVVTITDSDIEKHGYLKPNESIIIAISDEMKTDIEQMRNRDDIIRNIIINPDIGFCIGFNFEGTYKNSGGIMWQTRVFYHNFNKAYFDKLFKK